MSLAEKDVGKIDLPRVILGLEDMKKLRDTAVGMKRAASNLQTSSSALIESADGFIKLFDGLIKSAEK
jgi:hypothetical protein